MDPVRGGPSQRWTQSEVDPVREREPSFPVSARHDRRYVGGRGLEGHEAMRPHESDNCVERRGVCADRREASGLWVVSFVAERALTDGHPSCVKLRGLGQSRERDGNIVSDCVVD